MSECELIDFYYHSLFNDDVPQEERNVAMNYMLDMIDSPDGLSYGLENILQFSKETTAFIMNAISIKIEEEWNSINENIVDLIKTKIFLNSQEIINKYEAEPATELHRLQTSFIYYAYPEKWPDFWNFLFTQREDYYLAFLNIFCYKLSNISPDEMTIFPAFKQCMLENGIIDQIQNIAFNNTSKHNPTAFSIIASMCRWAEISWIFDQTFLELLNEGVSDKQCLPFVFNAISTIINRQMSDEQKIEIITNLVDPDKIYEIISLNESEIATMAAARLTYSVGLVLINNEMCEQYFELALSLLDLSDKVATIVINFLSAYTLQNPETYQTTITALMSRLNSFFEDLNGIPEVESRKFLDPLCDLFVKCFSLDREGATEIFTEEANSSFDIENNISAVTTIIFLYNHLHEMKITLDPDSFIPSFMGIMEIESPVPETHIFAVYLFYKLVMMTPQAFPGLDIQAILEGYISFVSNNDLPQPALQRTSLQIMTFMKNSQQKFELSQEFIELFLQSEDPTLVSSGASLLSSLPQEARDGVSMEYVQIFNEQMGEEEEVEEIAIERTLAFTSMVPKELSPPVFAAICELTASCTGAAIVNDDMMAKYINTLHHLYGTQAAEEITFFIEQIMGPKAVVELCCYFSEVLNSISEEAHEVVGSLISNIILLFKKIQYGLVGCPDADYNKMVISFFKFARDSLRFMSEETIQQMLEEVTYLLTTYYMREVIVDGSLAFLMEFIKNSEQAGNIATNFINLSLYCINAPNFDPNNSMWKKVICRIAAFHHNLFVSASDETVAALTEALSPYGLSVDDTSSYLSLSTNDARVKNEEQRKFFQDLLKIRRSFEF